MTTAFDSILPYGHPHAHATQPNTLNMDNLQTKTPTQCEHRHTRTLNVLIACEESQAECIAFRRLGHRAFSCDIQKARFHDEWHIRGDVTPYLMGTTYFKTEDGKRHRLKRWDLIIAHPPCTYLSKVGSLWLYVNPNRWATIGGKRVQINAERWKAMKQAREFFMTCLNAKAKYLAVENPIPMACAQLPKPTTFVHPSWFGVKYTKKTLYWLKNLPPIMPTIEYPNPKVYVNCSRGKYRSRTFPQVADALARQWSDYILDELNK